MFKQLHFSLVLLSLTQHRKQEIVNDTDGKSFTLEDCITHVNDESDPFSITDHRF